MQARFRLLAGVGVLLGLGLFACGHNALPTPTPPSPVQSPAMPRPTPPLPTLPQGFVLEQISEQPHSATAITRDDKYLYVTEYKGDVLRLADTDADGELDTSVVVASGFDVPRGLAFSPKTGELYISSRGQINALRDTDGDGVADENRVVVKNLFDLDYMHSSNGIAFGPDGKLYIADGGPRLKLLQKKGASAFSSYAGTILRANADGSNLQVYAQGFRNPFGLAFAADGSLYATENGEDSVKAPYHGDELNEIVQDGDYGFPEVLGEPPPGSDTVAPLVNFPADSAPAGLVVYEGTQFPEKYRGSIFVALWNVGHKIVRAWREASGKWQKEDFMTNMKFPVGMTVGSDGALYVLDMADGVDGSTNVASRIYRIAYTP